MNIERKPRKFVDENLEINEWADIEKYFLDLRDREINSKEDFKKWLEDESELGAVLEEDVAWRYIKMTIDTTDEEKTKKYQHFVTQIQPQIAPVSNELNKKLASCEFAKEYGEEGFSIMLRSVQSSLELFREENIPLQAKMSEKSQEFGAISGAQSVEHDGEEMTMQKAQTYLKKKDRNLRKTVYDKIVDRRSHDVEKLHSLFTELVDLRTQVAKNAGFDNYRDYKFKELGRFDYNVEDCLSFHDAIRESIVPLVKELQLKHKEAMGLEDIRPYDTEVDPYSDEPLKPFTDGEDLLNKSINAFNQLDPYFGDCLATMNDLGHLDLESKKGKSPGGYNYPLYEIGVPFIFMNAVGLHRDMVTMVHEGGHAVHSFLTRDLPLTGYKSTPSEVAELASMTMELITMDHWDEFFNNERELILAKIEQLQTVLKILPWIAIVDKFQHQIYVKPDMSVEERTEIWKSIQKEFGTGVINHEGYEAARDVAWQRQLHIFEVPFYYIEYGFAQLGAISVWKNFRENRGEAIEQYKNALKLGYTKSIPEIYETAGIKFDFSKEYVEDLAGFLKEEIDTLFKKL